MKPLSRVLTAVDFSEPARTAFEHALVLSRAHQAELTVVHAVPKDRPFRWQARERIALIAALRQKADAAGVRFKLSVQHGDPAGVILLHAGARHPDLIVLGTHQRSGLDRFRFGSVAEAVVLRATQPVLIVPPSAGVRTTESATVFDTIMVAVDFSAGSIAAIEQALSMAHADSRVTLVHVVAGIPLATASRYSYQLNEPDYQRVLVRDAWRRLQDLIPARSGTSPKVHVRVVIGDPSTELTRSAIGIDAGVIFVGVTRRGALGRRIFGSTAARVIRTAGRPVLAIPELVDQGVVPGTRGDQVAIAA